MRLARFAVAGLAVGTLTGFARALLRPRDRGRDDRAVGADVFDLTVPDGPVITTTIAAGAAG